MNYQQSLILVYTRILDLEDRERVCPGVEKDKLRALHVLVDTLLHERRALTSDEIGYFKLSKYKEVSRE